LLVLCRHGAHSLGEWVPRARLVCPHGAGSPIDVDGTRL
jgi:hypothetical protein